MVAKGFDSIEKRMVTKEDIKNLEKRLEKKIDNVENKLEGTNKRIDDLALNRVKYEDHNKLKVRVDIIEKTLNK
jgi:tetrahydromethanopterin S-methyltransferase subunit G